MDVSSKNRAVAEEREYDELEELHAQMNGEEEKLATLTSDLDMLRTRSDALARAHQMLEEEERAQQRRLEHLQLLQQLRKLQDMEPWAALQAASATSRACENVAPNTRSSTELMEALKHPAPAVRSQSSSVSVSSRCNAPPPPKSPQILPRPGAASPSEPHRMQPDAANEIQESPANDTLCNSLDRVQASDGSVSVLSKPKSAPADCSQQIYPSTAVVGAAAAAEDSMPASAAAVEWKARSSKPNKRANEEMGSCADAVSGKKARQNPMGFLCKFQFNGQCLDPTCPDIHLDANPPPKRAERPVQVLQGVTKCPAAEGTSGVSSQTVLPNAQRGEGGVGSGKTAFQCDGDGQGAAAGKGGAQADSRESTAKEGLDKSSQAVDAATLWRDFEAFSPRLTIAGKAQHENGQASTSFDGVVRAADEVAAGSHDSCGTRQQRSQEEEEEEAEEESLARLEEAWCGSSEGRYFGVSAQLSALREITRAQPCSVAAWISLADLFLQGHAEVSISQQLALNALTQGLEKMPSSLQLWQAYLHVLESQSAKDAHEMMEVAVQKVPFAISLWHRLAWSESCMNGRLAVWQRAAKAAIPYMTSRRELPTGDEVGWRHGLAMWIQAHVAAAAGLVAAGRRHKASRILSSAVAQLPPLLNRCLSDADRRASPRQGVVANVDEEGERRVNAERWVSVLEWLCVLSAQAATSWHDPCDLKSSAATTRVGRTPSFSCPGMGEGYEIIVSGCCGMDTPAPLGAKASQSIGSSAAAKWLRTIATGAQEERDTRRQQDFSMEAVEYAFNLLRSSTSAVALNNQVNGGLCGDCLVSPLLAQHYVMLLRRASPSRGACTARERILADLLRNGGMESRGALALHEVRSWIGVARVLLVLAKDAVLAQLSVGQQDGLTGSSRSAVAAGSEGHEGDSSDRPEDVGEEEVEGVAWHIEDEGVAVGKGEFKGEGGLLRLHALLGKVLETSGEHASGVDMRQDSCDDRWQAAWVSAECGYWMSRLGFANDGSQATQVLKALGCSLVCVLKWLKVEGPEICPDQAIGQAPRGADTASTGHVSSRILSAIQHLLSDQSNASVLEEARIQDSTTAPLVGDPRLQHTHLLHGMTRDRAEEGLIWWLTRSYLFAMILEYQGKQEPAVSASQQHSTVSESPAGQLLDKGLRAFKSISDSGAAACRKCSGTGAGCCEMLNACADDAHLCRDGLLLLGRSALCSEWLHLAAFEAECSGVVAAGPGGVPKTAILEILAQVSKGAQALKLPRGEGSQGGGGCGEVKEARGQRRHDVMVSAWETVVSGDGNEWYSALAVHSPGLLSLLCVGAGPDPQHQGDGLELLDLLYKTCAALPPMVALHK